MNKTFKLLIKEIVPIILGVLIALYINNWNEDAKDQKYIDKMLTSIDKELRVSNDEIKEKLPFQKTLIDTLEFYKNDDKLSVFDVMLKANGIQMPSIKITSWKAISRSKIELMDYDRLSALTNIEEKRELLLSKTQHLMNFIYPNVTKTGSNEKQIIILMLQDIMVTEKGIQSEFEEFFKD